MLDFNRLQTPPGDGDILVEPSPETMAQWAIENHKALAREAVEIFGRPLYEWRAETRRALAGDADRPVIVLGHQPEFLHAGVWSKHVVAYRLAKAMGGAAVNLIVDNDAPRTTALSVPIVEDDIARIELIPTTEARAGYAYEQIDAMSTEQIDKLSSAVKETLGVRFGRSCMEAYLAAVRAAATISEATGGGWVEQHVAGRRAIERMFHIELVEHRVSEVAFTPLLVDVLHNAGRFHASYNKALASYRDAEAIRGSLHPIPDLARRDDTVELPYWVYRRCEVRRRLFVRADVSMVHLFADRDEIGVVRAAELRNGDDLRSRLEVLGDWRIRPRALTLTLWARLILADLFIHGIGGAKYDRITDRIIQDYFGMTPPKMACVSATLLLDLPSSGRDGEDVRAIEQMLRDIRFNPQRHFDPGDAGVESLRQRVQAIEESQRLQKERPDDRKARRVAFRRIHSLNQALLNTRPQTVDALLRRRKQSIDAAERDRIVRRREYFFGLHTPSALERIMDALPHESDFAV